MNKKIAVVVPAYNEENQIGRVIDKMPEFVLGFTDATYYGNPYSATSANAFIYGAGGATTDDVEIAEYFVPSESINVNKVGFYCRKTGSPSDNLYISFFPLRVLREACSW